MIGPGAPINTDQFFVVCSNVIGGCYGSRFVVIVFIIIIIVIINYSGPSTINPLTGVQYGTTFPLVTVEDFVEAQFLLMDHLHIDKVHACIGASLGGMQANMAASIYPDRVGRYYYSKVF